MMAKLRNTDRIPFRRLAACLAVMPGLCLGEIATDGTLGPAQPLAGPDYAITSDLGQLNGSNLFHSFSVFNIATGESATFSGPASVANIISRVTGGSGSTIDGALNSSISGANLYLINPHGIVFGENASINVSGAFHASTGAYLSFADGVRFDAVDPVNPVLTSASPAAFGFLDNAPGDISVQGSLLELDNGQTLSLVGGDISIQDGILFVPEGTVQLVSAASAGEVPVDASSVSVTQFAQMGTIDITHTGGLLSRFVPSAGRFVANVDTNGDDGGRVVIRGGQFFLDTALIFADSSVGDGGHIDIAVSGTLRASNGTTITVDTKGTGEGGTMNVQAAELILETGGRLQIDNYDIGGGSSLQVVADSVAIEGRSPADLDLVGDQTSGLFAASFGAGDGGTVSVETADLSIGNGGEIELNAGSGGGSAGLLSVNAGSIALSDGGRIRADTVGDGNAGSVALTAESLDVSGGSSISTSSLGAGNAGSISIDSSGSVVVVGQGDNGSSGIFSNAFSTGDGGQINISAAELTVSETGKIQAGVGVNPNVFGLPPATADTQAGSIDVQVERLTVASQGQISTQSDNAGQAGNISVDASDRLLITSPAGAVQSGIFSTASGTGAGGDLAVTAGTLDMQGGAINVSSATEGNAGSLLVTASDVSLQQGAQLSSSTSGSGSGGPVAVQATGTVSIDGQAGDGFRSGVYSLAEGSGRGGDILVSAREVSLSNSGIVTAESTGSGDAGNILVVANNLQMHDSTISTEAVQADGGNVKVDVTGTVLLRDSDMTAAVGGGLGDGGNVNIDPEFVVLDSSRILASAVGGDGGNITIVTDHFISSADSVLDASSELGIDGTVNIQSANEEIDSNLVQLPVSYLNAAGLLREPCNMRHYTNRSSLTVSARAGLPAAPDSPYSLLSSVADLSARGGAADAAALEPAATPPAIRNQSGWLAQALAAQAFGCTM